MSEALGAIMLKPSGALDGRLVVSGALQLNPLLLVKVTVPVGAIPGPEGLTEVKTVRGWPYGREAAFELGLRVDDAVPLAPGDVTHTGTVTTPACRVLPRRSLDDGASQAKQVKTRPKTTSHEILGFIESPSARMRSLQRREPR